MRSRVWKRKYYHDLQHRKEQIKHTNTEDNLNNENETEGNIAKEKNKKTEDLERKTIENSNIVESIGNYFEEM